MSEAMQKLAERGAADMERCVHLSMAFDFAWIQDDEDLNAGREPHHVDDLIKSEYAKLLKLLEPSSGA
jgi:hypothetical protein